MAVDTADLRVEMEEAGAWTRRMKVTVPADRVKRARGGVARQIATRAKLPGFRQGKVPAREIEKRFGAAIDQQTLDQLVQESYREALTGQDVRPISEGKVEDVDWQKDADLKFVVEFDVRPEPEISRVEGFTVTRPPVEVTDEGVDSVIERLRSEAGSWSALSEGEALAAGDKVRVDITALDEASVEEDGAEPRSYEFELGEGQAIPAVEEAILNLAPGGEDEFDIRFPDDFPDEAQRGQERRLRIRVTEAERKDLPELDDEFAKAVGDFESVEALRARIREDLQADAEREAESEVRRQLLEQVVEANAFELPPTMVEDYLERILSQGGQRRRDPGAESEVREQLRGSAEYNLRRMLVVDRLAEKEGLRASQDDIDERIEEIASKREMEPSEVYVRLEKSGQLEMLENELTEDKVFDFLKSKNRVE
jgi:trigger factor